MNVIQGRTGAEVAYDAVVLCVTEGLKRSPRGISTLDVGPTTVVLEDPTRPVPEGINRPNLSPAIGVVEGLLLVAGETRPDILVQLSPMFSELLNSHGEADGAYGPRAATPLSRVVQLLSGDPDTRQAVALIWRPDDPLPGSRDVPCTVALTFYVVDYHLFLHAQMRSWDVFLGLPYDMMQFAILQCSLANSLSRPVGHLTVTATSLHLYKRDVQHVQAMRPPPREWPQVVQWGIGLPAQSWGEIRVVAHDLLHGRLSACPTDTERWLLRTLQARLPSLTARNGFANAPIAEEHKGEQQRRRA